MSFKQQLLSAIPYGLLTKIINRRYQRNSVIQYDPFVGDIVDSDSLYNNIVSVQGFGFSGSGAVVDYLREFSSCLVLGSIDKDGSKTKGNNQVNGEIDLLRHAGGLFEIELYLDDNNLFIKDALMKRFKRLCNTGHLFQSKDSKLLANQFYNQLIDFEIDTKGHNDYNSHTANAIYPDCNIKVMKEMSIDQYRNLCRRFLTSLFNLFYKEGSQYLVLDQLCNDFNYEERKYQEYIPNLKTIVVYRDPRDTYSYALMNDVPWIPHDKVESFIKWYEINLRKIDFNSPGYLVMSFEKLVAEYEKSTSLLKDYLGLVESDHTFQFSCFDPKESSKNISIWRKMTNYDEEMREISKAFPDFCYKG
jgi:hypothetical protein